MQIRQFASALLMEWAKRDSRFFSTFEPSVANKNEILGMIVSEQDKQVRNDLINAYARILFGKLDERMF